MNQANSAGSSNSNGKEPELSVQTANQRWQRRISERHYTEDTYRDRTPVMEYPSGTSPWASSPEASRTSFSNDIPREELPGPAYTAGAIPESDDAATHPTNGAHEHEGGWTPEQQHQWQQQQQQDQSQQHQQHQYQQHQQQGSQEENRRPAQSRYHNVPQQQRQHQPQYKLQAKITGLERASKKDSILKFDVYVRNRFYVVRQAEQAKLTVHQTNLPKFRTTQFRDIRRTHSEFQKFASHLIGANPEALVPAVPPASTSAGIGTEEDDARTKANMQRWLNVVCSNDVLMRDEEMVFFVESDFGYSPVARKKQPATGVRRKYLKQFQPPPDDTPELLESRPIVKSFYLGSMDAQQKVDKVVKHRRCEFWPGIDIARYVLTT